MANFGYLSGKDEAAVENLLSQAKDLYVLEQVAAINCSGFTDSSLPTNLETRFRRLKSLPVSRPDPVSSSSKKNLILSHSKSWAGQPEKTNRGGSAFSGDLKRNFSGNLRNPSVKSGFEKNLRSGFGGSGRIGDFSDSGKTGSTSCRLSRESEIFSGNKHDPSVNYGFEKILRSGLGSGRFGDFSDSVKKTGSTSCRFSRESKIFSPTTQTLKLATENSRFSSSSFTTIDLASPTSDLNPEADRSNRKSKSKSKFSISWFSKLAPSQAIGGCLWRSPTKSSSNSKKTKKSNKSSFTTFPKSDKDIDFDKFLSDFGEFSVEDQRKMLKNAVKESQRMKREAVEIIRTGK